MFAGGGRGREMQVADGIGQLAIDLFREGLVLVPSAQAGFDVGNFDALIESRQRTHQRRRRIALHQHPVGFFLRKHAVELHECAGGDLGQRLICRHQIQVVIRRDGKEREHLIEHLAVLSRDADHAREFAGMLAQRLDDRGHLDGFGARAEDGEDFLWH
jgi:hypothetical protein